MYWHQSKAERQIRPVQKGWVSVLGYPLVFLFTNEVIIIN